MENCHTWSRHFSSSGKLEHIRPLAESDLPLAIAAELFIPRNFCLSSSLVLPASSTITSCNAAAWVPLMCAVNFLFSVLLNALLFLHHADNSQVLQSS